VRKLILVIGCGRSGTNWLAQTLLASPDIDGRIEDPATFAPSLRHALGQADRDATVQRLAATYRSYMAEAHRHYLDKSHTNIWLAEALAEELPNALFLGISRDVMQVVASKLRHDGARHWAEHYERYPKAGKFLGLCDGFAQMSLAARCARHWLSHQKELERLSAALPGRMMHLPYEFMVEQPRQVSMALSEFLDARVPSPQPNPKAMHKWRSGLTPQEVADIQAVVCGG
jgi:hypothetical protein